MSAIIIVLCSMLLLGYLGEISSERTRIPNVILLLFLGWIAREVSGFLQLNIPDLKPLLPPLGTIGLILIVLEGALELEVNRSKFGIIKKSLLMAVFPLIGLSFLFGAAFSLAADVTLHTGLVNALPLAVISSSVAISGARNISYPTKEFVIYESSLSDIIGVLLFNFVLINESFGAATILIFVLQLILITLISFFSVIGLSYLLGKIRNHITYTPIILLVILIYAIAKEFQLSGLLFILVFGLYLGNLQVVKKFYMAKTLMKRIDSAKLGLEVVKFRAITIEATFLVRTIFFLLFGYLMDTKEFLNLQTLPWAAGIVLSIYLLRYISLKIMKLALLPLLYFTPRGLITILLFISIKPGTNIEFVNNSLIIQVIILSVITMMIGLIRHKDL